MKEKERGGWKKSEREKWLDSGRQRKGKRLGEKRELEGEGERKVREGKEREQWVDSGKANNRQNKRYIVWVSTFQQLLNSWEYPFKSWKNRFHGSMYIIVVLGLLTEV